MGFKSPFKGIFSSSNSTKNTDTNQKMTDSATTPKTAKLNFDGKTYELNSLTKETQDLVRGMQVADTQLRMYQDTLRILATGRQTMANQLREKLKDAIAV